MSDMVPASGAGSPGLPQRVIGSAVGDWGNFDEVVTPDDVSGPGQRRPRRPGRRDRLPLIAIVAGLTAAWFSLFGPILVVILGNICWNGGAGLSWHFLTAGTEKDMFDATQAGDTAAFTAAIDGTDYLSPSAAIDGGTF